MRSLTPFLLPLACLFVAFSGLMRLMQPERKLKELRLKELKKAAKTPEELASMQAAQAGAPTDPARLRRIRVAGLLLLIAGSIGFWKSGMGIGWSRTIPEGSDGRAPELEAAIREHCASFVRKGGSVGLAVAVVSGTNETAMAFGRQGVASRAAGLDTLFEIGSITKVFTGIALARAIDEGKVTLDQLAQSVCPQGVALSEEARAKVTLKHLTTHTSGFPRLPANLGSPLMLVRVLFGGDPYAGYTEKEFIKALGTVKLETEPGTKFGYSNFGTSFLGWLLATQAGSTYEHFIRRQVCEPLGMHRTVLTVSAADEDRFAQGHRHVLRIGPIVFALRSAPWSLANHLAGAGGIRSSATDMLNFLRANMRPGETPMRVAIAASHRELFEESPGRSIGMNWIRSKSDTLRQVFLWHNGGTGGFRSFMGFTEDGRAGVVILSNSGRDVDPLGVALLKEMAERARADDTAGPQGAIAK